MIHKPVLLEELIENLNLKPGMKVVDATLGAGGHAKAVLQKILPGGILIAIEWDGQAVDEIRKKEEFKRFIAKGELIIANESYANVENILRGQGIDSVGAVFADLGFSSDQVENSKRGFSFLKRGPLDMRYAYDEKGRTAAEILNAYSEDKMVKIFRDFGEERFAKRIARAILKERKTRKIENTSDLVRIVSGAIPKKEKIRKTHFATKVFQALRIEVNQELENLENFLNQVPDILASEGRLAIISFHSLEDRIVKKFLKKEFRSCVCPSGFPQCICSQRARFKPVTKKPIVASQFEVDVNPRSRSAKMRVAEKI